MRSIAMACVSVVIAVVASHVGPSSMMAAQQPVVLSPPLAPPPAAPMPAVLRNYKSVTAERLKNPEAADWLMVRRT